jgi:hypothetical protein
MARRFSIRSRSIILFLARISQRTTCMAAALPGQNGAAATFQQSSVPGVPSTSTSTTNTHAVMGASVGMTAPPPSRNVESHEQPGLSQCPARLATMPTIVGAPSQGSGPGLPRPTSGGALHRASTDFLAELDSEWVPGNMMPGLLDQAMPPAAAAAPPQNFYNFEGYPPGSTPYSCFKPPTSEPVLSSSMSELLFQPLPVLPASCSDVSTATPPPSKP